MAGNREGDYEVMQAAADGQHARVVPFLPTRLALVARVVLVVFGVAIIGVPVAPSTDAAITRPFRPSRTIALAPGIDFSVGRMRQPGYSVGVTLAEMGRLMLSLGATDALNLDGGGSTVMAKRSLKDGKFRVTNRPSDGRERKHSQALAAFELTASR